MSSESQSKIPKKLLGFWMCTALVMGNMIGSGVFMLPASLAPFGINSLYGWVLTAGGAVMLALVFAQLARALPQGGGPYHYVRAAFGEGSGFLIAWSYWISIWFAVVAIATAGVSYLGVIFPVLTQTPVHAGISCLTLLWLLTLLNYRGVRNAGWLQLITTVLKLLPLLLVILLGVYFFIDAPQTLLTPAFSTDFDLDGVTSAATLTLWAFLGFESATVLTGKVRDPVRIIPRVTIFGTLLTALIYILACGIVQWRIPQAELAQSSAPFADIMRIWWGDGAAMVIAGFAAISAIGALNGWILLNAEMPFVLAKDGVFPAVFARENSQHVPSVALIGSSVIATILVLMNYNQGMLKLFNFMIVLSTSACLFLYVFAALAAFKLARRGELDLPASRRNGFLALALLSAAYACWTLYGAGATAFFWGLGLLALGQCIYWWMRWQRLRLLAVSE